MLDRTGERRYFVLPLTAIDWKQLERLPPAMLWGEIYSAAVVDGERYWLSSEEITLVNQHNKTLLAQHPQRKRYTIYWTGALQRNTGNIVQLQVLPRYYILISPKQEKQQRF